jgi:Domain of unknown function (DUF4159)
VKCKSLLSIALIASLLAAACVHAQGFRGRGFRGCLWGGEDNVPPSTEVVVMRWRFGTNGLIGHCGWSHNYPDSEENLNGFVTQTTRVDIERLSYRLIDLGSEEIFDYPFAYISEPGEMDMTEPEVANLREYIERGGFILIDDFDNVYGYDHMANLREQVLRAFPDRHFELLTGDNPIFDLIFRVRDLQTMAPWGSGGELEYWAFRNSQGEIAIVACLNNDLANFWEWYDTPRYPLAPATEAFRMGVNYLVHALTH